MKGHIKFEWPCMTIKKKKVVLLRWKRRSKCTFRHINITNAFPPRDFFLDRDIQDIPISLH